MKTANAIVDGMERLASTDPTGQPALEDMRGLLLAVERLHKSLQQAVEKVLVLHRLSVSQWLILSGMAEGDAHTLTHFSQQLDRDSGSLSRAIYTLCQRGLVRPRRDPHDRRSSRLSLTPEGLRIQQDVAPRITRLLCDLASQELEAGGAPGLLALDDLAVRVDYCRQETLRARLASSETR